MKLQQASQTLGRGVLHGLIIAWLLLVGLPIVPCPLRCGEPVPELVAYTRLPGIRPEDAQKLLDWGASFPCSRCRGLRRVSALGEIIEGLSQMAWSKGSPR